MNFGQTIFSQLTDFITTHEFNQCVKRYNGNISVCACYIIKKRLNLNLSLYTILQILSVSLFEKTSVLQAIEKYKAPYPGYYG
jgi:hypothetical protein